MNIKLTLPNVSKPVIILTALTFLLLGQISSFAQGNNNEKINVGLIYPLSSNWKSAPEDTNSFSFNFIAGVSAAERGFTLAGITNVVRNDTKGFQIAGFSNHIGKKADGMMIAGFMNTYQSGNGNAIAGFGNFSKKSTGSQIAGFMNIGGNVQSVQVAGFANTAQNVNGFQLAGFMNIAKNVKGVQMSGFINIADSANCQIGIINISKNGEKSLGVTFDEDQTALLAFRSGGKFLYGIVGFGYNFKNKKEIYAWEAGLGAHIFNAGAFRLNAELTQNGLQSFKGNQCFKSTFALLPAFKIANSIEIFAGPSINYVNTNTQEGKALHKNYISSWGGNNGNDFHAFYWGYTAGVQVALK